MFIKVCNPVRLINNIKSTKYVFFGNNAVASLSLTELPKSCPNPFERGNIVRMHSNGRKSKESFDKKFVIGLDYESESDAI